MASDSEDDVDDTGSVKSEDDNGYETPPEIKSVMEDFQKQSSNGTDKF